MTLPRVRVKNGKTIWFFVRSVPRLHIPPVYTAGHSPRYENQNKKPPTVTQQTRAVFARYGPIGTGNATSSCTIPDDDGCFVSIRRPFCPGPSDNRSLCNTNVRDKRTGLYPVRVTRPTTIAAIVAFLAVHIRFSCRPLLESTTASWETSHFLPIFARNVSGHEEIIKQACGTLLERFISTTAGLIPGGGGCRLNFLGKFFSKFDVDSPTEETRIRWRFKPNSTSINNDHITPDYLYIWL